MDFLSISEARAKISELAQASASTTLTQNGKPVAVMVPIGEYRAIRGLLKLAENPEHFLHVMQAHRQVERGDLDEFVELDTETGQPLGAQTLQDHSG